MIGLKAMNLATGRVYHNFILILIFMHIEWILQLSAKPMFSREMLGYLHSYLKRFGYADPSSSLNDEQFEDSIRKFANHVGEAYDNKPLNLGKLIKMTNFARCSKPYYNEEEDLAVEKQPAFYKTIRRKRFTPHLSKWKMSNLKWRMRDPFSMFNNANDYEVARGTLRHALQLWSDASGHLLNFTEQSENFGDLADSRPSKDIDMDMFFAVGDHGDHEAFDGKGGIVAHSGYPMVGKIHFDADELWTIDSEHGIDLRYVTLHETGHALGLRHSKDKDAIMYPIYKKSSGSNDIHLSKDDTLGIRYLYGSNDIHDYANMLDSSRPDNALSVSKVDFEDYA